MVTGTQFVITPGSIAPALPATIAPAATVTFTIKFTPNALGNQSDTLNVTTTANNPSTNVTGKGVQIVPIAICSSSLRVLQFAFSDTVPNVLQKQLNSANSAGLLTSVSSLAGSMQLNGSIWKQAGQEKKLRRLEVFYENVGVGVLTLTVQSLRPQEGPDVFDVQTSSLNLGTALADLSERSAFFDIQTAGEILFMTLSRPASGGPLSMIGFLPHFEDAGEKVENV